MTRDRDFGFSDNQLGNYVAALEHGDADLSQTELKYVAGALGRITHKLYHQHDESYAVESDDGETYAVTLDDETGELTHYAEEWLDDDRDMTTFLNVYRNYCPRSMDIR